jgi:hypothetical protein
MSYGRFIRRTVLVNNRISSVGRIRIWKGRCIDVEWIHFIADLLDRMKLLVRVRQFSLVFDRKERNRQGHVYWILRKRLCSDFDLSDNTIICDWIVWARRSRIIQRFNTICTLILVRICRRCCYELERCSIACFHLILQHNYICQTWLRNPIRMNVICRWISQLRIWIGYDHVS